MPYSQVCMTPYVLVDLAWLCDWTAMPSGLVPGGGDGAGPSRGDPMAAGINGDGHLSWYVPAEEGWRGTDNAAWR